MHGNRCRKPRCKGVCTGTHPHLGTPGAQTWTLRSSSPGERGSPSCHQPSGEGYAHLGAPPQESQGPWLPQASSCH